MPPFLELADQLQCPIDWEGLPTGTELTYWLDFLWYARCHSQQVDKEVTHSFSSVDCRVCRAELREWDQSELQAWLHNVKTWIAPIREPYLDFIKRFSHLRAAGRDVYAKHYCPPAASFPDILELSVRRSASILAPSATVEIQEQIVWTVLDDLVSQHMAQYYDFHAFCNPGSTLNRFEAFLDGPSALIAVRFIGSFIGACAGQFTEYAMIDFDFSTPQFHIYPISLAEYQAATIRAEVDGYEYGLL